MTVKRTHVVHIIHRFDTGGLENGVVNLINHLGEQDYYHSIVTLKGHDPEFARRIKLDNVRYYDLKKRQGNDIRMFFRLNRLLKQLNPDVLHTRNTATLEAQVVGWWRRIPLRIHGEHGWDVNDMHGQNPRYQKLRRLMRRFIHQYIALSIEARDYLLHTINVRPERVNHICNGVDDTRFVPADKTSDDFVVGCVGRLEAVKNHVLLARAFAKAWEQAKQQGLVLKLQLLGEGSCRGEIEAILKAEGCHEDCWLPGDRSDIPQRMQDFDVFVLPSLAEGISNTILEAMSTGLPVIATDVGGNGDLVDNGNSGYLVPSDSVGEMAQQILNYATQPALLKAHGSAGRCLVEEKFSIDAMTRAYDALYQRVR